jgi:hypothetical protein
MRLLNYAIADRKNLTLDPRLAPASSFLHHLSTILLLFGHPAINQSDAARAALNNASACKRARA